MFFPLSTKSNIIVFFTIKNTHNLINLLLFHGIKIVNRQKIKNIPIKKNYPFPRYIYIYKLPNKKKRNHPRHIKIK